MNEVQLMIVSFLFILSIWFLIILLGAIRQEQRFKRMEENLERFKKSQEEERLTNKKVEYAKQLKIKVIDQAEFLKMLNKSS